MTIWWALAILAAEIAAIIMAYYDGKRYGKRLGFNLGVDRAFQHMHSQVQQSQAQQEKNHAAGISQNTTQSRYDGSGSLGQGDPVGNGGAPQ